MIHCTHSESYWKLLTLLEMKIDLEMKRIIYLDKVLVIEIQVEVQNYSIVDKDYFRMKLIFDE
jgi:hypothetical protein